MKFLPSDFGSKAKQHDFKLLTFIILFLLTLNFKLSNVSAETYVSGYITSDTTWTLANSPYVVTDHLHVEGTATTSATLTIEPGVEIKFNPGTGLFIAHNGGLSALSAQGTESMPIKFTSANPTPANGDWRCIYFFPNTDDAASVLDHCIIEYGGNLEGANIYCNNASPAIRNCTITNSNYNGIYATNSTLAVSDCTVTDNSDNGINVNQTNLSLFNNTISQNSNSGVNALSSSTLTIMNNNISDNTGNAIYVSPESHVSASGNTISGNGSNSVAIRGGYIEGNRTWPYNESLPYVVTENVHVEGTSTTLATLTIEPGVEVKFNPGTGLFIAHNGGLSALSAQGTETMPIRFTSSRATPVKGDWRCIYFFSNTDDAASVLDHCIIEYGGNLEGANIYCNNASPTIRNCTIQKSSAHGIWTINSNSTIENTVFNENEGSGFDCDVNSTVNFSECTFSSNQYFAGRIPGSANIRISNSVAEGNGENGIQVYGSTISKNAVWANTGNIPYIITDYIHVEGTSTTLATLTIEPGVEVKFNPGMGLFIADSGGLSALVAQGTETMPIRFTSSRATPLKGDWRCIYFSPNTDDSASILEHCIIEYGGNLEGANIYCNNASPTIRNCTIINSSYNGIHATNSAFAISNCSISQNESAGIYGINSSNLSLTNNSITNNAIYAIQVSTDSTVSASGNTISGNGNDTIAISGGEIRSNRIWKYNENLPYTLTGSIFVYGTASTTATLIIEPGTTVKIKPGEGIFIATYDSLGALVAQGTETLPITFTSSIETPLKGDWRCIYFYPNTNGATTVLENCIIEYAGSLEGADIYCENASPVIRNSTIKDSYGNGIYLNGAGCNTAVIENNLIKDNNTNGVYLTNNAQPAIRYNNFIHNTGNGVYNSSSVLVTAENNWWGDPQGPGFTGDNVYGNVDFDPWLLMEASTSGQPTNFPPDSPRNPFPVNNAVKVSITGNALDLRWTGTDQNVFSILSYDVYLGETPDTLLRYRRNITTTTYTKTDLEDGKTYYWKIIARDDGGLETPGPVWSFTTVGPASDLIISDISWTPETIHAGEELNFTATLTNIGQGPLVDQVYIDFKINDSSIGSVACNQIISAGESASITKTWTAAFGNYAVSAVADAYSQVSESDENNNTLTETLPEITDNTPPELISTTPVNNSHVAEVSSLTFQLFDRDGSIDDVFVIGSVILKNSQNQNIAGSVTESNDVFSFTPSQALTDEIYTLTFTAKDNHGNSTDYAVTFTLDSAKPAAPAITGGTLRTGTITTRPFENQSNARTITLEGTRENGCSIWINGTLKVNQDSGDWSTQVSLNEGNNSLEIWANDFANNKSDSVWIDINVDSIAPVIESITPVNETNTKDIPSFVSITFSENGSLINEAQSLKMVKNASLTEVPGTWIYSPNQLVFTPSTTFQDDTYTIEIQLEDNFGNKSNFFRSVFIADTTPPSAPVLNAVTTPTNQATQTISGVKEPWSGISMNGNTIIDINAETTWQKQITLAPGSNTLSFSAFDRANNVSSSTQTEINFEDTPPPQVNNLTVASSENGTSAILNWTGYPESTQGDVKEYQIFREPTGFSDISSLVPVATVEAGTFGYTSTGLSKGATYWFAVVAVDTAGQKITNVNSVSVLLTDTRPPEPPENIQVESHETSLVFRWTHSANTENDLSGYKLYFNGATDPVLLDSSVDFFEATSLLPASSYSFEIKAFDSTGNESGAVSKQGVTWLLNPLNLSVTPYTGYVDLSFTPSAPAELIKHYAIYCSETDFTNADGLTPVQKVSTNSGSVAGLETGKTYYFAVTTVNLSDGENKAVTTISGVPVADTNGPVISDIKWNNEPLTANKLLSKTGVIYLTATDPVGVSRVEFFLDGEWFSKDSNGSSSYSAFLNLLDKTEGSHTLLIKAYDSFGAESQTEIPVQVEQSVPDAPLITSPASGFTTNRNTVKIEGTAERLCEVYFTRANVAIPGLVQTSVSGKFSAEIDLEDGINAINAICVNTKGESLPSSTVNITLDTSIPFEPVNVTATQKASGVVKLSWTKPAQEPTVSGYNVYRSETFFSEKEEAQKINSNIVTTTFFEDLTPEDKTYYYRITTIDTAGNEGFVSQSVSANSDRTPPIVLSIDYVPQGGYDEPTGRMSTGVVDLLVKVSEPLQAAPYFCITPTGSNPISVELFKQSDTEYKGLFVITDTMGQGTAYAVFSARDMAGNRGTEIESGDSILIDTKGPDAITLSISPETPINNPGTEPVILTVRIGLNGKVKQGTLPELYYQLSGTGRIEAATGGLGEVPVNQGEEQAFQCKLALPLDAGSSALETLKFRLVATDDLGNQGGIILASNLFEVYSGGLPALSTPSNLKLTSLSNGRISLTWDMVSGASGYQIYRKAQAETEFIPIQKTGVTDTYTDTPPSEGVWHYAIASIRTHQGEESESPKSAIKETVSDSTAPLAPISFTLELTPKGVKAEWNPPPFTETVTYSLYRAGIPEITTVEGLTPLVTGIEQTSLIDPTPSADARCYVVTAVDACGNESTPSNSFYLNFDLLPVSPISIVQDKISLPILSWNHSSANISGYNLYIGDDETAPKINSSLLPVLSYTDTGYTGQERWYGVTAVDNLGFESLKRFICLPEVKLTLINGKSISDFPGDIVGSVLNFSNIVSNSKIPKRGLMNRLCYLIENNSGTEIVNAKLHVKVDKYDHVSQKFNIPAFTKFVLGVPVGGYSDLPFKASLTEKIDIEPNSGENIQIIRQDEVDVGEGMLALKTQTEEFTRGVTGKVRFSLENTGDEAIEIVTALSSGTQPSDEILFNLIDPDGNILSTAALKQSTGENLITLSNGKTIAKIDSGETWQSDPVEIIVPSNVPGKANIKTIITNIHYHLNREDHVVMQGINGITQVNLVDTAYFGEIIEITPLESINTSFGKDSDEGIPEITIKGRSVNRENNQPLPSVPLNLILSVKGYERTFNIITGEDGTFTHKFKPLAGEAGIYSVYLVHPDLLDRKLQGQFTIKQIIVRPSAFNLKIPKNYLQKLALEIKTGDGTTIQNLQLKYEAADQENQLLPEGVHVDTGYLIQIVNPNQTINLPFNVWGDNNATSTGNIKLRLDCDDSASYNLSPITINFELSEANPSLFFTPNYLETGMARNDTIQEVIKLENKGLSEMLDVTLSLVKQDGTPAPDWIKLASEDYIESIAPGTTLPVNILFMPGESVSEGYHDFYLRVSSLNHPQTDIGIYAAVTQSGLGNALFKILDIFTGTLAPDNSIIQGLQGANVTLQHETVTNLQYTRTSDAFGEALFEDLPTGTYKARISANEHQEWIGRLSVKPGITASQQVFLDYNLVTVEWKVVPVTIEDKYEIILDTTFKTEVPAPVIICEPGSTTIPSGIKKGDIFNGEFRITNYGLIKAKNVKVGYRGDYEFFDFEMEMFPEEIDPKEQYDVPFKMNCHTPPEGPGDCKTEEMDIQFDYEFEAECGEIVKGTAIHHIVYKTGNCDEASSPAPVAPPVSQGGGMSWSENYGSQAAASVKPGMASEISTIDYCYLIWIMKEAWYRIKAFYEKYEKYFQIVGCSINEVSREFEEDIVDLNVKVPGGFIEVRRRFHGKNWHWDLLRKPLYIVHLPRYSSGPNSMVASMPEDSDYFHGGGCKPFAAQNGVILMKREVPYYPDKTGKNFFHDTYVVKWIAENNIWKWQSKDGEWEEYDEKGWLLRWGDRTGLIGEMIIAEDSTPPSVPKPMVWMGEDPLDYEDDNHFFTAVQGVKDRNGRQVLWFEYGENDHLTAIRDNSGRRIEYTYDTSNNGVGVALPSGNHGMSHATKYFDPYYIPRPLETVKDVMGRVTTYESINNQLIVTNPKGHKTIVTFDPKGGVVSVLDENNMGHKTSWRYDSTSKLQTSCITSTCGNTEETMYDKCGDMVRETVNGVLKYKVNKIDSRTIIETDEKGRMIKKEFDEWKNPVRITHQDGTKIEIAYDPKFHFPVRVKDRAGIVTVLEYDDRGNVLKKIEAFGTEDETISTYTYNANSEMLTSQTGDAVLTMTYDSNGNLTSVTDPTGNKTEYLDYDNMGNFWTMKNAMGQITTFEYDNAGRLVSKTDPLGNTTTFGYNSVNNMTSLTNPYEKTFLFEYDGYHNATKVIDPLEGVVETVFDQNGNPLEIKDQNGNIIQNTFDSEGRILTSADGANNVTKYVYNEPLDVYGYSDQVKEINSPVNKVTFEYDSEGRVVKRNEFDGANKYTTSYEYNVLGQVVSETDPENRTTLYEYDNLGRLKKTVDPAGGVTEMTYNVHGNVISIKDPNEGETKFEYDLAGRRTKVIRPMGQETRYEYNGLGLVTTVFDSKGQKIGYEYNENGKLKTAEYFESTVDANPIKTVSFDYNNVGNLISYDDGTTSALYEYDDLQRKVKETINYGALSLSYQYEYYPNSLQKAFIYPDGTRIEYVYDSANRLSLVKLPNGNQITYNSYKWNAPTQITFPGGAKRTYSYDSLMRVTNVTGTDPGSNPLLTANYEYSQTGNLLSKTTEKGTHTYQYDELSRLKSAVNPNAPNEAFSYDPLGNRLSQTIPSVPNVIGNFTYNQNNEITDIDLQGFSVSYDSNGNISQKIWNYQWQNYFYDTENRLTQVDYGVLDENNDFVMQGSATYYYDPFGRRLKKTVTPVGGNSESTYYLYSNEGLVGEYNELGEEICSYGYNPGSNWTTDPLFMSKPGVSLQLKEFYFYQNDAQGTPYKLTSSNGAVVWDATYDSFGNCTVLNDKVKNNLRFPGQYFDEETGLHYNWNRYYSPELGKYLTIDPLGEGLNLYAYVFNRPTVFIDPTGTQVVQAVMGVAAIVTSFFLGPVAGPLLFLYGLNELSGAFNGGTTALDMAMGALSVPPAAQLAINVGIDFIAGLGIAKGGAKLAAKVQKWSKGLKWGSKMDDAASIAGGVCFVSGTEIWTKSGFKKIEDIKVGQRVFTTDKSADGETEVDESWKLIKLQIIDRAKSVTPIELECLHSPEWIEQNNVKVGEKIHLIMDEMGIDGEAAVLSISPCPEIEKGEGRVVLSTVVSSSQTVMQIYLEGLEIPLEPTARHRLYSEDRKDWISAETLKVGESLRTENGTVKILKIENKAGVQKVYNFEVETDHCYYVSKQKVLSHNNNPCAAGGGDELKFLRRNFEKVKPGFISKYSDSAEAIKRFNSSERAFMKEAGRLPEGWVVHHKVPLYRGGTNDYSNFRVMKDSFHRRYSRRLHYYKDGENIYGLG